MGVQLRCIFLNSLIDCVITQSGLCIKKILYVMIASVGIYACFGAWLALMYQLIEVIIGLDN